ncbi:MAG: glycoside hydrolase family 16 protein [Rhizobiales bacterium]|nr:glycoside hydrolase family 16 protein [Hyphomicrobiales bacterium]MBI3673277.1 glycoside hydrolase family 16 protein [Hyphomicrobiales bacterium]
MSNLIRSAVVLVLAMAAGLVARPAIAGEDRPLGVAGDWKLVFAEDFNGPSIDLEKWTTCYWWNDNGCTNLSSGELQWYMPANVRQAEGTAYLTARPEPVKGYKGREFAFTSGMLTTGRDYSELPRPPREEFTYGYFEIRAKVPAGKGLWPAVWLLPSNRKSRPEIDIMEVLGHATDRLEMHLQYDNANQQKRSAGFSAKVPDLSADWRVYGLDWQRDKIVWYLDGVEKWRFTTARYVPQEPMYLLINLAVGGTWPGAPNAATKFPADFLVDYVKVWQRRDK